MRKSHIEHKEPSEDPKPEQSCGTCQYSTIARIINTLFCNKRNEYRGKTEWGCSEYKPNVEESRDVD